MRMGIEESGRTQQGNNNLKRYDMNKKEMDIILSRIERLSVFLEDNTLEGFQKEILRVEKYLQRFGKLDELLSHLKAVEKIT